MKGADEGQFSPPAEAPKRIKPWLIAIGVILVGCCTCFGMAGLLFGFGGPILDSLGLQTLLALLASLY